MVCYHGHHNTAIAGTVCYWLVIIKNSRWQKTRSWE